MSLRNFLRAVWFGTILAAMCLVCMYTLTYLFAQFTAMKSVDLSHPFEALALSTTGWAVIIVVAFMMSRKILRTAIG